MLLVEAGRFFLNEARRAVSDPAHRRNYDDTHPCGIHVVVCVVVGSDSRQAQSLQRLQEVEEILHLLRRESDLEALIVEIHELG